MSSRRHAAFVLLVLAGGCKRERQVLPISESAHFGSAKHMTFTIGAVYEKHRPSTSAPWHEPGGDWTFFDARLTSGARFGFGVAREWRNHGAGFGALRMALTVPDGDEGAKLVAEIATAFGAAVPPAVARQPLRLTAFDASTGERDLTYSANGFRRHEGGGDWAETKIPFDRAQLGFNYSARERRGELVETAAHDHDALVAALARRFRDGPPAPLEAAPGPRLDTWKEIGGTSARLLQIEANGALFADGESVFAISFDDSSRPIEVTRAQHRIESFDCVKDLCLLVESTPKEKDVIRPSDPHRVFLVDRAKKTKTRLTGAWDESGRATTVPIAPDGSFVALRARRPYGLLDGVEEPVYLVPVMDPGAAKIVQGAGISYDVVGWTAGKGTLAAAIRDVKADNVMAQAFTVDTRTEERDRAAYDAVVAASALAPNGKHRIDCSNDRIAVVDIPKGTTKSYVIAPEERRELARPCPVWANARYLRYDTAHVGLIDITTMKRSYLAPPGTNPETLRFSADLAWAIETEPRLRFARVVVP